MVSASGFDRKTLMLATQLANECNMRNLLLAVLEALLETMGSSGDPSSDTEALTLARCIIRLIMKLIGEPGSNRCGLSDKYLMTADVLTLLPGLDHPWPQYSSGISEQVCPIVEACCLTQRGAAILLIKKLEESVNLTLVIRDIAWLWRAAYNCAIQGCSEWEHAESTVSDIFDIARQVRCSLNPSTSVLSIATT